MRGVGRTREEFVNHELQATDLRILRVYFQQPKWFIMPLKGGSWLWGKASTNRNSTNKKYRWILQPARASAQIQGTQGNSITQTQCLCSKTRPTKTLLIIITQWEAWNQKVDFLNSTFQGPKVLLGCRLNREKFIVREIFRVIFFPTPGVVTCVTFLAGLKTLSRTNNALGKIWRILIFFSCATTGSRYILVAIPS